MPPIREEYVLRVAWGGLGDHLFCSHFPRVAKSLGAKRFYVNDQLSEWRHPDYKRIWLDNPYCDGFTDKPSNEAPFNCYDRIPANCNICDANMLNFGLDDGKRFHDPEFYYKPTLRPEWQNLTVFDPNCVNTAGSPDVCEMRKYLQSHGLTIDAELSARGNNCYSLSDTPKITTPTLHDYADLIASCRQFICLTSGGATLAAALHKPSICFYGRQSRIYHHYKPHTYVQCLKIHLTVKGQ